MDPFTIIMLVVLAALIFFMFRNSRKRQNEAKQLQSKVVPGADVMTNFGMFGTILSIDEDDNKVALQTSPGTIVTVHRQTIARVVEPAPVEDEAIEPVDDDVAPEYGERVEDTPSDDAKTDEKPKSED